MRRSLLPLFIVIAASAAQAGPSRVTVVAQDDRGITVRLDVGDVAVGAPEADGRVSLAAPGLEAKNVPGRPPLPMAPVLVAVPQGARATARIVQQAAEEARDLRLEIGPRPGFRPDREGVRNVPTLEDVPAIRDGAWPASPLEVGQPFEMRRQRMVTVRIHPFRYDEEAGRLWQTKSLTVRIDFVGGTGAIATTPAPEDAHWEPVLRGTLINYEQGRRFRSQPRPAARLGAQGYPGVGREGTAGASFDEDEPEVRILTDSSAVYALPYLYLSQNGYPALVPISEVSVHRHEFVPDASPPYVTIELPIEVDDADNDGVFDDDDTILLFVQSWGHRSRASFAQRYWGEGEVVYATRVRGRAGARIPSRSGWRDQVLTPLFSYPWTQRWERNLDYMPVAPDTNSDPFHWTFVTQFEVPDSFHFETNDLDPARAGSFTFTWQGRRRNQHNNWVHLRNGSGVVTSIVDSLRWFGNGALSHTTAIPGTALTEGFTNRVRQWGKTDNSPPLTANTGVNWFEATYWRRYRSLRGYLSCTNGDASGVYQIDAERFGGNTIRVYDVTDSLAPVRLTLAPGQIRSNPDFTYTASFQDSVGPGGVRRYVVFDGGRLPDLERVTPVTRRRLTDDPGDYLVVVPEAFQSAVAPLVAARRAQGHDVLVAPLESINDEFNGGRRSSWAIKRFVRHAYENWNARFVLIVGDGSEDPLNYLGDSGKDWVPVQRVIGPVPISDGAGTVYESIPSDPWYVWCVDCEGPVLPERLAKLHDLFIGRIPANSLQAAEDVIEKILDYEVVTQDQTWRRNMLFSADDLYSTQSFFGGSGGSPDYCRRSYEAVFRTLSERCRDIVRDEGGLGLGNLELFDLQYYLRDEPFIVRNPGDTCRVDWFATQSRCHGSITPILLGKLNQGFLVWNYQGHANQYVLSHEDLFVNRGIDDDKALLSNVGKPFLFSAFSCHPNGFAMVSEGASRLGPSIGEEVVMLPDRGAVASWASSGYEILPTPVGRPEHLNTDFIRTLFADPPRDPTPGRRGAHVVLGEAVAVTLVKNYQRVEFDPNENAVGISYNLLGDPATRFTIGAAQMVVTANGQPVQSGEPVRLGTVGDTLLLEADVVTNVAIGTLEILRGDQVVPPSEYTVTPAFPDTLPGGTGGRAYHISYRTTLQASTARFTIRAVDRYGAESRFEIVFPFQTVLRAGGVAVQNGDPVAAQAELAVAILSPAPIDPDLQIRLTLNDGPLDFSPRRSERDTSGREWTLSWTHLAYAPGTYTVRVYLDDELVGTHVFTVTSALTLDRLVAFPNPFDEQLGTHFSFTLTGPDPADVRLRIYTVSGRLIYERVLNAVAPGYQQLAWDGRDAEGQEIANGVYLYRLQAHGPSGSTLAQGRLVKLRKPRRLDLPAETP